MNQELSRCRPTRSLNLPCLTLRLHHFELWKFDPPSGVSEVESGIRLQGENSHKRDSIVTALLALVLSQLDNWIPIKGVSY